ncbi:hypothetical protein ES703_33236 [subsurface metagenome]
MPSPNCRPPRMKNGTSAPSSTASPSISGTVIPVCHSSFSPFRTAAASLEPPPRPAPAGMRFSSRILMPRPFPVLSLNNVTARIQRLLSSVGTPPAAGPVTSSDTLSLGRSVRIISSPMSISWKRVWSRWRPFSRRPTIRRPRLILALAVMVSGTGAGSGGGQGCPDTLAALLQTEGLHNSNHVRTYNPPGDGGADGMPQLPALQTEVLADCLDS